MVSQKHRAGSSRVSSSKEEFMKMQKPNLFELKKVQRVIELDEEEELTDREIWIMREYLD